MPEEHKAVYAWSSERFLSWAEKPALIPGN